MPFGMVGPSNDRRLSYRRNEIYLLRVIIRRPGASPSQLSQDACEANAHQTGCVGKRPRVVSGLTIAAACPSMLI